MEGDRIENKLLEFSKGLQGCDILSSRDPVGLGQRTEPGASKELTLQAFYNTFSISAAPRTRVLRLLFTCVRLETFPRVSSALSQLMVRVPCTCAGIYSPSAQ